MPLKLYGVPLSQPFRSVAWTMLQKQIPFEVKMIVPGSKSSKHGSQSSEYTLKSRMRTSRIPILEDSNGFTVAESPAILTYLCERYGWKDSLYAPPGSELKATIDSYLHWHHTGTRQLALVCYPYLRPEARTKALDDQKAAHRINSTLRSLEEGWLTTQTPDNTFIAGTTLPTIADILAYEEVVQLIMLGLFDHYGISLEEDYPRVHAWVTRMETLPYHMDAHVSLKVLGNVTLVDVSELAKRLGPATKAGLDAIAKASQQSTEHSTESKL